VTASCPRCHLPVAATCAGVVLDAEPHRLGVLGLQHPGHGNAQEFLSTLPHPFVGDWSQR
jgi:hypothetical protein